jgi:hypothetical protein
LHRKPTDGSPKQAILYAAVALFVIAIGGHLLFPSGDLLWLVLAVFGLLAVPQGLLLDRSERRNRQ